uniref:Uncharacterized protein n=1 Tax=Romanomermis culicivorax TaxID=13658 RepID=A0A915JS59_ROMCU
MFYSDGFSTTDNSTHAVTSYKKLSRARQTSLSTSLVLESDIADSGGDEDDDKAMELCGKELGVMPLDITLLLCDCRRDTEETLVRLRPTPLEAGCL